MPNIEIHGYDKQPVDGRKRIMDAANGIRNRIIKLLSAKNYSGDAVVTIVNDETVDFARNPQPFLRVVSTPQDFIDEIVEALKTLDMDVEVQELKAFHPRK